MRLAACLAAAAVFVAVAPRADAHAFLLRSTPAVGSAVARSPQRVVLVFSEPVAALPGTDVIGPGGTSVLRGSAGVPHRQPAMIVLPLRPGLGRGRYLVRWREVDQTDGHRLAGSFEFAIGRGGVAPGGGVQTSSGFSPRMAAARWLLIVSVLLGGGFVLFRRLALRPSLTTADVHAREARIAALALALALVAAAAGAGILIALEPGGLATGYARRMLAGGLVAAAGAVAALVSRRARASPGGGATLVMSRRALVFAEAAALALLVLPSATGHAVGGTQREALGVPADVVHVVAAAAWVGGVAALALVAPLVLRPLASDARRAVLASMAHRFAPIALTAVGLLAVTGLVRAVGELSAVSQLWSTGYGRALVAKTLLLTLALGLVALNRGWLARGVVARALTPELGVLVALTGVVAVLTDLSPGRTPTAAAARATAAPVVVAGRAGDLAVVLSMTPRGDRRVAVRATVIDVQGPRSGLVVRLLTPSGAYRTAACGRGCYRATVPVARGRPRFEVAVATQRQGQRIARIAAPAQWPAPAATQILRRAELTWRRLRSLSSVSRIASGPGDAVTTEWRYSAPNRLAYRNDGGSEAILIGRRRWDRGAPGAPWQRSAQDPVRQPVPPWSRATAFAHVLGTQTVAGRKLLRLSFLDRSGPAWFTVWIDPATYRTQRVTMIAQAHFMREAYGAFDRTAAIKAPRR
jgi:copper transport protein